MQETNRSNINSIDPTSEDQQYDIKRVETVHLANVIERLKISKKVMEESMDVLGKDALERLTDLKTSPETGPDYFFLLEQLNEKFESFNLKDKFQRIEEINYLMNEPYFARIDLKDKKSGAIQKIYIGKFGFSDETPVVTDWRAPIASIYYKYRYPQKEVTYTAPMGTETRDMTLKRTFEIYNGILEKLYNNDIQLDESKIISDKISRRTGGVLEDIVATIQKDQIDIIESDPRQVCIVQGCVGSGKSTVAIHKLAYIFFNYQNYIRPYRSILIAKNQILVSYLSTLFPKLGIFDIAYKTLRDLVYNVIFREDLKLDFDMDREQDTSEFGMEYIRHIDLVVDNVHKMVEEKLKTLFAYPDYQSYGGTKYSKAHTPYENVTELVTELTEELESQQETIKEEPQSLRADIAKENIKNIKAIVKKLSAIKEDIKHTYLKNILSDVGVNSKDRLSYSQALQYLHIYGKIIGYLKYQPYEYCIVDEGQDFSLLEYAVLNNFVLRGRFGIFGDLNQSLEDDGIADWENVKNVISGAKSASTFFLTRNYRSTKQIIDFANAILSKFTDKNLPVSINRLGFDPKVVSFNSYDQLYKKFSIDMSEFSDSTDKTVGIIVYDPSMYQDVKTILEKNIKEDLLIKLDPTKKITYLPQGVYLMSMEDSKGLEFSKVFVVGMDKSKINNYREAKKAFVAVTRAMNDLSVYYVDEKAN